MTCNCKNKCNPCGCGLTQGERCKADALSLLETRREVYVRRGRRALLEVLLRSGNATADDVRELVELPPGIDPKLFGSVPGSLVKAGIIRQVGFAKTCRAVGHARPVAIWQLVDRQKAEHWLRAHPDMSDSCESESAANNQQRVLFNPQESATPTAGTIGVADSVHLL